MTCWRRYLSGVIRERFKIMRQVQVFTAQGRLTLYLLSALPPGTALMLYFMSPDYILPLFKDPLGHQIIGVAVTMQGKRDHAFALSVERQKRGARALWGEQEDI